MGRNKDEVIADKLITILADRRINATAVANELLRKDPDCVRELVRTVVAMGTLLERGYLTTDTVPGDLVLFLRQIAKQYPA